MERKFGPLAAIEPKKGFLLDELALVAVEGQRVRFDLLAGQMDIARDEASHYLPQSPLR